MEITDFVNSCTSFTQAQQSHDEKSLLNTAFLILVIHLFS